MKRPFILFSLLALFVLNSYCAKAQKVTFMPQWTPQSQFAGYYMALKNGYYTSEGLDVTIKHIGVNSAVPVIDMLQKGNVQIITLQLPQSIIFRDQGFKIVNVLQTSQNSALYCVTQKPVKGLQSLDGMKVGRWKTGYSEIAEIAARDHHLNIEWIPFISGINLYIYGAVDAILCYSYSEYLRLLFALGEIPNNQILKFSALGYNYPEDAVYVTEDYYYSNRETVEKFVKATKRGWNYVRDHREEALDLVMLYVKENKITTNRVLQKFMLDEVLKLQINPDSNKADFSPVDKKDFDIVVNKFLYSGIIKKRMSYKEIIK